VDKESNHLSILLFDDFLVFSYALIIIGWREYNSAQRLGLFSSFGQHPPPHLLVSNTIDIAAYAKK
jgi:hypothetical protein